MVNFLLGTVAGSVIACVATIAAARHPDIQARLGLIPIPHVALSAAAPVPPLPERCPVPKPAGVHDASAAMADKLFEPRRFWLVSP